MKMDLEKLLESSSARDHARAASFLMMSDPEQGSRHQPTLIEKCRSIDSNKELNRYELALLSLGVMALGSFVRRTGFDQNDLLHDSILRWILEAATSPNAEVVGHSIYALGTLGSSFQIARNRLIEMLSLERRENEHEHVSLRSLALRVLRRIDAEIVATFCDNCAFKEFAHAVNHWISTDREMSAESQRELAEESAWIAEVEKRRSSC